MAHTHRSKSKKQTPLKNQRKCKYEKQILGVMFARGMFGESRLLAGTLRSESQEPNLFKNQRDGRYHKQNLGGSCRRVSGKEPQTQSCLATTSDSSFFVRYQLCFPPFPMGKGISACVLSPLRRWTSLAGAFSVMGGLGPPMGSV